MPWHHSGAQVTPRPENVASARRYRGVNVLALWIAGPRPAATPMASGGRIAQWQAIGAQVRRGEPRGSTVVLWKQAASRAEGRVSR